MTEKETEMRLVGGRIVNEETCGCATCASRRRRKASRLAREAKASQATADQAYREAAAAVRAQLKRLTAQVDEHQQATGVGGLNWGHVGDLTHLANALGELLPK